MMKTVITSFTAILSLLLLYELSLSQLSFRRGKKMVALCPTADEIIGYVRNSELNIPTHCDSSTFPNQGWKD